jgi:hypothetical protein
VTIAVSVKVNDGLVLATDSASTLLGLSPGGQLAVVNVYNNATKLLNLCKGLPLGVVTWGSGSIGQRSTSTALKDLRDRLSGKDRSKTGWALGETNYTVEGVANLLKSYIFDELYTEAYKLSSPPQQPDVGFIVAGFSPGAPMADEFQIEIQKGKCAGPKKLRQQHESGATYAGDTEALNRLINGWSQGLLARVQQKFNIDATALLQTAVEYQQQAPVQFVLPPMPLQDAIDLAEFFVETTIKFNHFKLGAPTVGGPIELAAISKHEGFRWVRRKYYFERRLNPEIEPEQRGEAQRGTAQPEEKEAHNE